METPYFKKLADFPVCMWKWGESAPSAKHAFGDQMGPSVQKAMLFGSPPHQGPFFLFLVIFLPFLRCWPYFEAGIPFGGFSSTKVTKFSLGSTENPYFGKKMADLWQIWPYSQVQRPYSHIQSGATPGSYVGDTSDWILFLWFILNIFCLCTRSATSHLVQNTQSTVFLTQSHFLTHER